MVLFGAIAGRASGRGGFRTMSQARDSASFPPQAIEIPRIGEKCVSKNFRAESRARANRPAYPAISPVIGFTPIVSGNTVVARICADRPNWSASRPFSTARMSVVGLRSRFS